MADIEERRETGRTLIVIGVICWVFAALVMFFNPAAIRRGSLSLVEIAAGLIIIGAILAVIGLVKSKRAR
jgi:uncharacterized membrane protein